jgi:hypothetical protein
VREHRRDASPAQRSTSVALQRARRSCTRRTFSPIGRSPHIPRRTVKGAQALAPSPAWSPGRRGQIPIPAAAPVFPSPVGQTVHTPARLLYIADKVLRAPACVRGLGGTVEGVSRLKRAVFSRPKRSVGSGVGRRATTPPATLTAQLSPSRFCATRLPLGQTHRLAGNRPGSANRASAGAQSLFARETERQLT